MNLIIPGLYAYLCQLQARATESAPSAKPKGKEQADGRPDDIWKINFCRLFIARILTALDFVLSSWYNE